MGWARSRAIIGALALAGTAMAAFPGSAAAQDTETRLRKLEAEVRALQRKVFPGGDERFFTPEITAPAAQQGSIGAPAESAVTDILARVDAVEAQLARLTSMTEVNSNSIATIEERLGALETRAAGPSVTMPQPPPSGVIPVPPANSGSASATPPPAALPATPTPERLAAVRAIAKPETTDPGDDEYSYGFRLWDAGFYPEAQQQLKLFLQKYPTHWRATYARNLLGRAYLDDRKPAEAAPFFLENYQSNRQGERAPDSLLYLAEAMIAMSDTNRACIALAEFGDTYPGLAMGRLQSQYEANRRKVSCN